VAAAFGEKNAQRKNESEAFRIAGIALSAATGFCLGAFLKQRFARPAAPRIDLSRKAVSAVTGGPPEDMNEMPPTFDPEREGPVYDGSQLPQVVG